MARVGAVLRDPPAFARRTQPHELTELTVRGAAGQSPRDWLPSGHTTRPPYAGGLPQTPTPRAEHVRRLTAPRPADEPKGPK